MEIRLNNNPVNLTPDEVKSANVSFSYCRGRKFIITKKGEKPITVSLRKLMKAVNESDQATKKELQEFLDVFAEVKNSGYQQNDPQLKGKPFLRAYMRLIGRSKKTYSKLSNQLSTKISKLTDPITEKPIEVPKLDREGFEKTLNDWMERKALLEANAKDTNNNSSSRCKLRAEIYQETVKAAKNGFYVEDEFIQLDPVLTKQMLEGTKLYSGVPDISKINNPGHATIFEVLNEDTFVVGKAQLDGGYNPVILNLANAFTPGGGVAHGAAAQEESLCRDSNYHEALLNVRSQKREASGKSVYPIDGKIGEAVYTPAIQVFRGKESDGFPYIKPFPMAAIACAAVDLRNVGQEVLTQIYLNHPEIIDKSADAKRKQEIVIEIAIDPVNHKAALDKLAEINASPEFENETKAKIRVILATAIAEGHDSLVLGSFGCGVFQNNPVNMARLFKEVLDEYQGYFRKVDFAILEFSPKDTATSQEFQKYFKHES